MSNIKNWSKTPGNNTSAAPDGAPEGWAPSAVNNTIRQQMADHRTQWESAEWFNWGHIPTRLGNNVFLVSISNTVASAIYTPKRRLKLYDGGVTINAEVVATSSSGSNALVSISSSAISTSLTSLDVSILDPTNPSQAVVLLPGTIATETQVEEHSLTTVAVTPFTQGFAKSAAKAWVHFTQANSTVSAGDIKSSYNIAGITRDGIGVYRISFSASFSNAYYCPVILAKGPSNQGIWNTALSLAAGHFIFDSSTWSSVRTLVDGNAYMIVVFGIHES